MPAPPRTSILSALDAGHVGVWVHDVAAATTGWTVPMARLHGATDIDVDAPADMGVLFDLVHPDDRAQVDAAIDRVTQGEDMAVATYRVLPSGATTPESGTLGGGHRWVTARFASVHDATGLALLAVMAIDATERTRVELENNRRRAAVESMQWVHQAIISGEHLAEITAAIARAATGVLGADCGVVVHPVPGDVDDALGWVFCGVEPPATPPPQSLRLPDSVATADDVRVIDDITQPGDVADMLEQLGLPDRMARHGSAIVAPIGRLPDKDIGVMVFTHPDTQFFTGADGQLARSIASSASMAIENAQRHEQQRLAAMTFQRQLLPDVASDVAGLDVCVRYHPGRDGMDVGGDWYDVIDLDAQRIGLAVGDVCGHGLSAAADMGQFRYSFRAGVQTSSVEQAFSLLNHMALRERRTTATVAYVELDTQTGSCAGWSCGHLPPVIATADGSVRWLGSLETSGPMLGFLPDVTVSPIRTTLAPGETLLLYTDGLVERRGESIDDGLDRLAASFVDRSPGLDALCDELYDLLADMGPDADDTALLAVRRPER